MKQQYLARTRPVALPENCICGKNYRLTLLTDRLVRLEYDEAGQFEDRATQTVWYRDLPAVPHTVERTPDALVIRTEYLEIRYDEGPFSPNGLCIRLQNHSGFIYGNPFWHYGDKLSNLKGTARTLDQVNGDRVELGDGVLSRKGIALLDDSRSLLLSEDGTVLPRTGTATDVYVFAYGHDYPAAIRALYAICGKTPMLPRFVLGNWWSRYHKYTQEEYLSLMDRFAAEKVPLSVAVIDMDWHLVDIDPQYGSGWTGFTWNRELFPDHVEFLRQLHDRGLRTTLNLHPADGIRAYEDAYPRLAEHMGIDPQSGAAVAFDPCDPQFLEHYYEDVLHPMEDEGVDFWWMDWQQGTHTRVAGLDPLWMLNHYDFLDSGRSGKRPLTFSRYSGPGSHRYPIGFSGDTHVTWESLQFQPQFTAMASNIGYGWWSHDIGGHTSGYKDNELMARWTQFGVFSPIMRLHSTSSDFNSKEPWRYSAETEAVMKDILRFRHRMVPYLYTMNRRASEEGEPLVQPLYHRLPELAESYTHPNEYFFGSELLAAPITTPRDAKLRVASEKVYLPEGVWYDIFAHRLYRGGRETMLYRPLEQIPVFLRAGGILPLTEDENAAVNPTQLHLCVCPGADGAFTLYEDDNETTAYEQGVFAQTAFRQENGVLTVEPSAGHTELLPAKRTYLAEIFCCKNAPETLRIYRNGKEETAEVTFCEAHRSLLAEVRDVLPTDSLRIEFAGAVSLKNDPKKDIFRLLDTAELAYSLKSSIWNAVRSSTDALLCLNTVQSMTSDPMLIGAISELLSAY